MKLTQFYDFLKNHTHKKCIDEWLSYLHNFLDGIPFSLLQIVYMYNCTLFSFKDILGWFWLILEYWLPFI